MSYRWHTIPINAGDLLSQTAGMSAFVFGAYFRLYLQHFRVGDTGLPDKDTELARIIGETTKKFKANKASILKGFKLLETSEGMFWVNDEVISKLYDGMRKSEINRTNALKRNERQRAAAQPAHSEFLAIQYPKPNIQNKQRQSRKLSSDLPEHLIEDWQKKLHQLYDDTIYQAWFAELYMSEGYIICPSEFKKNWVQTHYEGNFRKILGESFLGFKVIEKI